MLQYSAPVWTALLGWWLVKEKPHWEHWGALIMVVAGLLIFFRGSYGSGALLGDLIALSSGIFFGANSVFMRMMKDDNPQDAMLMAHVLNAAISIPFIILYPPSLTASGVLSILYLGTIQLGLASALFSYGIKRISAIQAMLTSTLEPILNPFWVLIVIGERPSTSALTGGGIIIAAVLFSSIIGKRRETVSIGKPHS
jgi:drug/metabolite transporter (DMT)-like permease